MNYTEKIEALCRELRLTVRNIEAKVVASNDDRRRLGMKLKTPNYIINWFDLRKLVNKALKITDPHTVNGWIHTLVAEEILEPNPTSNRTPRGYIKPSNNTRFYINIPNMWKNIPTPTHSQTKLLADDGT